MARRDQPRWRRRRDRGPGAAAMEQADAELTAAAAEEAASKEALEDSRRLAVQLRAARADPFADMIRQALIKGGHHDPA